MLIYYKAIILGIIEGLTEFLPISSTGHLIIAGKLLNFTGPKAETFEIVIQLGAILAVVWLYKDFFINLFFPSDSNQKNKFQGIYGLYLLFLTTLPAGILGLLTHHYIKKYLFSPQTVAWALLGGAIFILLVENFTPKKKFFTLDQLTPRLTFFIGCFQCLALWPGFSRSAATILGAMLLGVERKLAAKYSFLAAVPIMFAATGYDLLKSYHLFNFNDFIVLGIGFITSFIFACIAVKGFIYLLEKITLKPFAYYRIVLALIVLILMT
ncbi:MAG: undecaprenyl-diphosphate phosphatase [Desulfonauticus sp.]|nr:undecaprenyl-diphosphate phosphatase [Desulfonauticus sp.]